MSKKDISRTLVIFNHIYRLLYDGKIPEDSMLVNKCEEWMREHREELKALIDARKDFFVSDRELNALALALEL